MHHALCAVRDRHSVGVVVTRAQAASVESEDFLDFREALDDLELRELLGLLELTLALWLSLSLPSSPSLLSSLLSSLSSLTTLRARSS